MKKKLLLLTMAITISAVITGCDSKAKETPVDNSKPTATQSTEVKVVETTKPTETTKSKGTEENVVKIFDTAFTYKEGSKFYYNGYAEYGHVVEITELLKEGDSAFVKFKGEMADGRGNVDGEDRSFYVSYEITDESIKETITSNNSKENSKVITLNSIIPNKIILKSPLAKGTTWQEEFKYEGKKYTAENKIEKIETVENNKQYTVTTTVKNIEGFKDNTYKEERIYELNRGLVSFQNSIPLSENEDGVQDVDFDFGYGLSQIIEKK